MLPRLEAGVRRLGRMLGKPVELRAGEIDLELDAGVARQLVMALEHVLRDAVCHGIEKPGRRRALGKAASGRIRLEALQRNGYLVIEIEDDGCGIDVSRIRELAGANGLLARDSKLGEADCAQYVFAAGLSTVERPGSACGRGMGLSAARAGIARLGGRIAVDFRPGCGARFVVRVPGEIHVEPAWVFSVRNDPYAVLDDAVEETVPVTPETVCKAAADGLFECCGERWEFRAPGELPGGPGLPGGGFAGGAVLLLRRGERRVALYADAHLHRQKLIVGGSVRGAETLAGVTLATLLEDGSLVALLNPWQQFERTWNRPVSASPSSGGLRR